MWIKLFEKTKIILKNQSIPFELIYFWSKQITFYTSSDG